MKQKYAIITGASRNGIGAGFARRLIARGYIVYLQYRDDAALARLEKIFSFTDKVKYVLLGLHDIDQMKNFFIQCKEEGITFDVVVLAAGGWKSDTDKRFKNVDEVIQDLLETNFLTKKRFINAFFQVYENFDLLHLFLISSHISSLTLEEAVKADQLAYITSMKEVNGITISHPNVSLHILQTERIETDTLKDVRDQNPDVPFGEDNDTYAEEMLLQVAA